MELGYKLLRCNLEGVKVMQFVVNWLEESIEVGRLEYESNWEGVAGTNGGCSFRTCNIQCPQLWIERYELVVPDSTLA